MACYRPIPAYQNEPGEAPRVGYWSGEQGRKMELPCGHCAGCRMDRRCEWSIRCTHEAQLYDSNVFLSLDYAPEHLRSASLEYRDVELWLKRLRRRLKGVSPGPYRKYPIRFFLSGEYGPLTMRPHWHAILFNCRFPDQVRLINGESRSDLADELWAKGRCVIGDVTPASISYVAGYTMDKLYGRNNDLVDMSTGEILRPQLVSMSRRPGIGTWWYEKYKSDLFGVSGASHDFAVIGGKKRKVPRFYWKLFYENEDELSVEDIREKRLDRAAAVDKSEETEERRAVREEATLRRVKAFSPRKSF